MASIRIDLTQFDAMTAALLVWGAMVGVILLFLLIAGAFSRRSVRRRDRVSSPVPVETTITPADRAWLRAETGELIRQAAATAAAAKRARLLVAEARERAHAAQQAREVAWQAFDTAQKAYVEARQGMAAPATEAGGADDDSRREVARAALAAYKRGDISVDQLGAVFRKTSGWDETHEARSREIEQRRVAETRARRAYQAAAAAERSAYRAADVAVVAARALAEESVEVAAEARTARMALGMPAIPVPRRPVAPPPSRRARAPRKPTRASRMPAPAPARPIVAAPVLPAIANSLPADAV